MENAVEKNQIYEKKISTAPEKKNHQFDVNN